MPSQERRVFLEDMLSDSNRLEKEEEPAQAFDKLARAIEMLLPDGKDRPKIEKVTSLLSSAAAADPIWRCYVKFKHQSTLANLASEMTYYVAPGNREAAATLRSFGSGFQHAVERGDRVAAARQFARWFLLLRNKRFHGDPTFSGRNIRLVFKMNLLLELLRNRVELFLADSEQGRSSDAP